MATLEGLRNSVSELSDEELMKLMQVNRTSRRTSKREVVAKPPKAVKEKKGKTHSSSLNLNALSEDQALLLLALLDNSIPPMPTTPLVEANEEEVK